MTSSNTETWVTIVCIPFDFCFTQNRIHWSTSIVDSSFKRNYYFNYEFIFGTGKLIYFLLTNYVQFSERNGRLINFFSSDNHFQPTPVLLAADQSDNKVVASALFTHRSSFVLAVCSKFH